MGALDEHEKAVEGILPRCDEALAGPQPPEMVHVRFAGQLAGLQGETAGKLGRSREDGELKTKFDAEDKKLKELCGL